MFNGSNAGEIVEASANGARLRRPRSVPGRDHSFMKTGAEPGYEGFLEVLDEVVSWAEVSQGDG